MQVGDSIKGRGRPAKIGSPAWIRQQSSLSEEGLGIEACLLKVSDIATVNPTTIIFDNGEKLAITASMARKALAYISKLRGPGTSPDFRQEVVTKLAKNPSGLKLILASGLSKSLDGIGPVLAASLAHEH